MRILIIGIMTALISGCATVRYEPVVQQNDSNLSCAEIKIQIEAQKKNKNSALVNSIVLPNMRTAIKNSIDRIKHLKQIAENKNCPM